MQALNKEALVRVRNDLYEGYTKVSGAQRMVARLGVCMRVCVHARAQRPVRGYTKVSARGGGGVLECVYACVCA